MDQREANIGNVKLKVCFYGNGVRIFISKYFTMVFFLYHKIDIDDHNLYVQFCSLIKKPWVLTGSGGKVGGGAKKRTWSKYIVSF